MSVRRQSWRVRPCVAVFEISSDDVTVAEPLLNGDRDVAAPGGRLQVDAVVLG